VTRAALLAAACLLIGGPGVAISTRRFARALRFRFQRGRPYIPGSIRRTAFSGLVFGAVATAGAALAATLWITRDLQPIQGAARAGQIRVSKDGGALLLELRTPGDAEEGPVRAAGLAGPTWMVTGMVIAFPEWLAPVGLDACHGIVQAGGPDADLRPLPPELTRAVALFRRLPA
jgi:hypothetical protein